MHLLHIHTKSFLKLRLACLPRFPSSPPAPNRYWLTAFNYTVLSEPSTFVPACNHSDRASKETANRVVWVTRGSPKDMGAVLSYKRKSCMGNRRGLLCLLVSDGTQTHVVSVELRNPNTEAQQPWEALLVTCKWAKTLWLLFPAVALP